jgi:drug/metabolite transporter (DMT)-like permease
MIMKKQYLYAGISILLWSTTATVTKLLLGSLNSMQILLISSFFAFIFLLIVNAIKGNLKELRTFKLKDYIQIIGIGLLGTFLYNLFLYLGINKMQATQAFIINYLWPIMTIVFACFILKEKMTVRKMIAIVLSFIGVIIVTSNGNLSIESSSLIGALFCILAAISYGLFSVLNKMKKYNKFVSMMLFYLSSFIVSLLYILITKEWYIPKTNQLMGLLWIGIMTSAISFTSWALALEKGNTAKISNLAYITPFLSLIWTGLVLKETITIYAIIGLIVIVLGIFIQMRDSQN